MFVKVLGAAAGGAFPQWNCSCKNCTGSRNGSLPATARSQTQLAISADASTWFLVQASPDLRYQIEACPALHPRSLPLRDSPIRGIVLTSAEIDAALGLLLLRESQPLHVYATGSVRRLLTEDNAMFAVLRRQPDQVSWHDLRPGEPFTLGATDGERGQLTCTPMTTGGGFPGHVSSERAASLEASEAVIGLFLEHGGRQVAFFPGALEVRPEWLERMAHCDAIFFDGTFWSDQELICLQGKGKTARGMGHLPLADAEGTLEQFRALRGPRKIFIHINNTNPILDESSPEYRRIREEGWELASDGMELQL